ncbi:MAG: hypothetical protein RLZZ15_238, partial [Verrucomicrobiota bacterium]
LTELAAKGEGAAIRARRMVRLWYVACGALEGDKEVREAMEGCAADPNADVDMSAMVAMGRVWQSRSNGFYDLAKAKDLFDRAAKLGSLEGRSWRARMLAEGRGVKKDVAAALAELRQLESEGDPTTLALLGYYHYWGARGSGPLPEDPRKAFEYSKRAADLGDPWGQYDTALAYMDGIGTEKNYALAASYCRAAAWRGWREAETLLPRVLAFVQ